LANNSGNGSKSRPLQTLCVTCANAVPQLCGWVDRGDMNGLEEYMTRMASGGSKVKPHAIYIITRCANYREGSLPELPPAGSWSREFIQEIAKIPNAEHPRNFQRGGMPACCGRARPGLKGLTSKNKGGLIF